MKLKATINRILQMCPQAWYIFIRTLQLSAALLLFAVFLLIESENRGGCHDLYSAAWALYELPQALILIAGIGSACIEDIFPH